MNISRKTRKTKKNITRKKHRGGMFKRLFGNQGRQRTEAVATPVREAAVEMSSVSSSDSPSSSQGPEQKSLGHRLRTWASSNIPRENAVLDPPYDEWIRKMGIWIYSSDTRNTGNEKLRDGLIHFGGDDDKLPFYLADLVSNHRKTISEEKFDEAIKLKKTLQDWLDAHREIIIPAINKFPREERAQRDKMRKKKQLHAHARRFEPEAMEQYWEEAKQNITEVKKKGWVRKKKVWSKGWRRTAAPDQNRYLYLPVIRHHNIPSERGISIENPLTQSQFQTYRDNLESKQIETAVQEIKDGTWTWTDIELTPVSSKDSSAASEEWVEVSRPRVLTNEELGLTRTPEGTMTGSVADFLSEGRKTPSPTPSAVGRYASRKGGRKTRRRRRKSKRRRKKGKRTRRKKHKSKKPPS